MSDIARARELLVGLAEQLGLETLLSDEEDMALLEFDNAPAINLVLGEDGSITLTAYLGEAPEGNLELAEELLASNLNWRDTDGATLSMERHSRGVFLARRWAVAEFVDSQGLSEALEQFTVLARHWTEIFPQLSAAGAGKGDTGTFSPDFAGLRA